MNKLAILKKEFEASSCGLDESASASTETQNYTEPYVEEPLADEGWLQNCKKEQGDKEGLAREVNQRLYVCSCNRILSVFNDVVVTSSGNESFSYFFTTTCSLITCS